MLISSALIASYMVVQAGVGLPVSGKANGMVICYVDNVNVASALPDSLGNFEINIPALDYQSLSSSGVTIRLVDGTSTIQFDHVFIGDVYAYYGQSNAGKPRISPIKTASLEPNVSVFRRHWRDGVGEHPLYFAKEMVKRTGHKIGLLNRSVGGSRIEQWYNPTTKNFNREVAPVAGYPVRGFIWWQGEADAATPTGYGAKLSTFIASCREAWGSPLPFFVVEIPTGGPPYGESGLAMRAEYSVIPAMTYLIDTNGLIGSANGFVHPADYTGFASRIADSVIENQ